MQIFQGLWNFWIIEFINIETKMGAFTLIMILVKILKILLQNALMIYSTYSISKINVFF